MKAVIVAAGRSSRLYPLTSEVPKPLIKIGRQSIIERSVDLLNSIGISDVLVVVGFHQEKIRSALGERTRFILNPFYQQTNNMVSLWLAMPRLQGEEFIYLHGDVVYDKALLTQLATENTGAGIYLLVDFKSVDDEAMRVRIVNGHFVDSNKDIPLNEAAGEWIGLARITPTAGGALYSSIEMILGEGHFQDYDTAAFNHLAQQGVSFELIPTDGLPWCEIDTQADLKRARLLFEAKSDDCGE